MNAHMARRPAYTHAVKTHDDVVRYMQGRSQAWAWGSSPRKRPLSPPPAMKTSPWASVLAADILISPLTANVNAYHPTFIVV